MRLRAEGQTLKLGKSTKVTRDSRGHEDLLSPSWYHRPRIVSRLSKLSLLYELPLGLGSFCTPGPLLGTRNSHVSVCKVLGDEVWRVFCNHITLQGS